MSSNEWMDELTTEGGTQGEGCLIEAVKVGGLLVVAAVVSLVVLAVIF